MPELTPPPMSEEHRARLLLDLNSLTADGPSEIFSLIVDRVSAARDEQWRQRLEAVAVVGDLVLTIRERAMGSGALNRATLYRIKEQGSAPCDGDEI